MRSLTYAGSAYEFVIFPRALLCKSGPWQHAVIKVQVLVRVKMPNGPIRVNIQIEALVCDWLTKLRHYVSLASAGARLTQA